jgi:hypothetical protein
MSKINSIAGSLLDTLKEELKELDYSIPGILERSKHAIQIISDSISQLKRLIKTSSFDTIEEEVRFFKTIKPGFLSKLIFYQQVYRIWLAVPAGGRELKADYLKKQLKRINTFRRKNMELIKYLDSNSTFLDEYYFSRGRKNYILNPFLSYFDDEFSSQNDHSVSMLLAYQELSLLLENEINELQALNTIPGKDYTGSPDLQWTDSKIALVELIYALHASRSINNGKTEILELAKFFQNHFSVQIADIYRKYIEIKNRKINPTKFIDFLSDTLQKKIEEEL